MSSSLVVLARANLRKEDQVQWRLYVSQGQNGLLSWSAHLPIIYPRTFMPGFTLFIMMAHLYNHNTHIWYNKCGLWMILSVKTTCVAYEPKRLFQCKTFERKEALFSWENMLILFEWLSLCWVSHPMKISCGSYMMHLSHNSLKSNDG